MGNNNLLELHIYDGASGKFTLIEDDGISNDYLKGIYATTSIEYNYSQKQSKIIIQPVEGYFDGMAGKRVWRIVLHNAEKIKNIRFEGDSLNYIKNQSVIEFELPAADKYRKTEITILK